MLLQNSLVELIRDQQGVNYSFDWKLVSALVLHVGITEVYPRVLTSEI